MTQQPSEPERRSLRETVWRWFTNAQFFIYSLVLLILLVLTYVAPFVFIMIPTGYSAVMYRYFAGGTVTDRIWGEGLHVIPPWDTLTLYETRLIEQRIKFDILSDEGLDLGVEVSIRYRPDKDMLGFLHQDVGPEYYERLVKPEVESHIRKTFGQRPAHEIYGSVGDLMQELRGISMLGRVDDDGEKISSRSYVSVQEIKLVDIDLPPVIESFIAAKYGEEQAMLEYEYKLLREEKEAERKRIEASGIRDYNKIASTISHDLLRWRDLEATLTLAQSPNSKVVVLGGGAGSTPLIFNLSDAPDAQPAADPKSPPRSPPPQSQPTSEVADAATSTEAQARDASKDRFSLSPKLTLPSPIPSAAPPLAGE